MRFEEAVNNAGHRKWNVDCDVCGTKLTMVGGIGSLVLHLKTVKHSNALSAGEDPATRVVLRSKLQKHAIDEWRKAHAAEHKMHFEETPNRKSRQWNVDCGWCRCRVTLVGSVGNLRKHLTSARHRNAMSAGEDPATRVVFAKKNGTDEWLKQHAAEHHMQFEENSKDVRGKRNWRVACSACGWAMAHADTWRPLERHVVSTKHVNALSADEDPATRVVQHRQKNGTDEWLQEHAAEHHIRFEENIRFAANLKVHRCRNWRVHCDACGWAMAQVSSVAPLKKHVASAKHGDASSKACLAVKAQRKRPRS
jgi:hypothetical protein